MKESKQNTEQRILGNNPSPSPHTMGEKQRTILGKIQDTLAVSEYGAKSFLRAMGWTALQNLTLMLPMFLVFLMIDFLFQDVLMDRLWFFLVLGVVALAVMYVVALQQYDSTYPAVYRESGVMRVRLAEQLRRLPLSFFDRKNPSDLTNIMLGDVNFLENCYSHQLPQLVGSLAMLILVTIGLFFLDWRLTLALFWALPVVLIILGFSWRAQKQVFKKGNDVQLAMNEKMEEGMTQAPTIKSYGGEERYLYELRSQLGAYEQMQMKTELSTGTLCNGIMAIIRFTIPTLVIVGVSLYLSGAVALNTLLFFILVSVSAYTPLIHSMTNGFIFLYASVRIDRMRELTTHSTMEGTDSCTPTCFDLCFREVTFGYNDAEQLVLDKVSFTAKQGEVTALIGPSGSGKSTCARMASRFWDPQSGSIYLGDLDIASVDPEVLLQHYAIVFQDVTLFNNTVMENIRLGRKNATDEEVLQAARLAQCDEFVKEMPKGYDTIIGENGGRLSGGERQRISIARALLKDAPIIILDEATASQDAENETLIQQALSHLIREKTVLIIAHRMRTIRNADKVVVLDQGRVIEQGKPSELYQQGGLYKKMCDLQQSATLRQE